MMKRLSALACTCVALAVGSVAAAGGQVSGAAPADRPAPRMTCAQLTGLTYPDIRIAEAAAVAAASTGPVRAAHCRVDGVIGTEIHFTLLLPDQWNGRLFMGGGGGFVGTVQNSAQSTVNLGYATVGTDTGHQADGLSGAWALNNLERRVNFGYLAVHRTAQAAKAIVAAYYGSPSTRNYFGGCSRGGGQAVMEAIRFPEDFDGIVAGAPALDWTGIGAQFIKDSQALFPEPPNAAAPLFPEETLKAIGAKVVASCDRVDGVEDGLIADPRQCTVDFTTLPLTEAQRSALKRVYGETRNRDGVIAPGQPYGGEADTQGWQVWITGPNPRMSAAGVPSLRYAFGTELFKYFVFNDPAWDYRTYDFSTFERDTALTGSYLNATNPDLSAFKAKGHKLIVWHGWSDAALTALRTIEYYEQVEAKDAAARDYARLFMMPGVLHCGGGAGPDDVDWTTAIVDWVEHGTPPDRLVARKRDQAGAVLRTRPLCPYPQRAVYTGQGSTDAAESFVCR